MIKYHDDIQQGTEEWYKVRCGKLTASEVKLIVTPATLKIANNEKTRAHVWELLAQRVTQYVEPHYETFDMMRGKEEELDARISYNANYDAVQDCGFIENDDFGFSLGYSPDGLIGDDGLIEAKSRCQKYQMQTYVEDIAQGKMPDEFVLQVQTGLLVTQRKWCDFISYSNGLPMATVRVLPDDKIHFAIIEAATAFEKLLADKMAIYNSVMSNKSMRLVKTERKSREMEIRV